MANWKVWNYKIKLVELGKNMNIYKWKKVMNHKVTGYGLAFFMPVLLYLIVMIYVGFYPFGDQTIVTWDMQGQYLAFLAYFRRILLGQENLFFTQSMTLGGANVGLLAYYTLSPLNLILVFFSEEKLPIALLVIMYKVK